MRVAAGAEAANAGYGCWTDGGVGGISAGAALMLAACALAAGLFTFFASSLAIAALAGAAALGLPLLRASGHGGAEILVLFVAVCLSMILLGPGAYSLDARMFGRREIVIPRSPRSPQP